MNVDNSLCEITTYDKEIKLGGDVIVAKKFEKDGLWGLESPNGSIILPAKYDKIEVCADFIYAHYGNRKKFFYKSGRVVDRPDREDDYRFYENGRIGLLNPDGSVLIPAVYDEIIDWGSDCDVVYVRRGKEFHYLNHGNEEILSDPQSIAEDAYPLCPYSIGEDQNRGVLLCVEPVEDSRGGQVCFAFGQWCSLSRISCSEVRNIFSNCNVVDMPQSAIDHFYDIDTYIYSARRCKATSIMDCIKKLEPLGCYDSSWIYLVKVSVNSGTTIDPHDLYGAIRYYEDLYECIKFHIAIENDDSLDDGVVELFQIHYFWDDNGAFLEDSFVQKYLPEGTRTEVEAALAMMSESERERELRGAMWWVEYSENREWTGTKEVLEYLMEVGSGNLLALMEKNIEINPCWMEFETHEKWEFRRRVVEWAIGAGGRLNAVKNGKTRMDGFVENLDRAREQEAEDQDVLAAIRCAEQFLEWLKSVGAVTAAEQRRRIEISLDGLAPKDVFELVSKT